MQKIINFTDFYQNKKHWIIYYTKSKSTQLEWFYFNFLNLYIVYIKLDLKYKNTVHIWFNKWVDVWHR